MYMIISSNCAVLCCAVLCYAMLCCVVLKTKETFRYPVSANSSGSVEAFSPKSTTGPSPPSKRRQKQLEMRRSISPTPGKSIDDKLAMMQVKSRALERERDEEKQKQKEESDDDDEYGDDPNHTGDYSMDDFDEDSPTKLPLKDHRPSSASHGSDNDVDTDKMPAAAPALTRFATAPLPARVLTEAEEEARRSMDEIKNRWASLTSGMHTKVLVFSYLWVV
jgi:hypothetical protein